MTKQFLFLAIIILLVPLILLVSRDTGLQAKTSGNLAPAMVTEPVQTSAELGRYTLDASLPVEKVNLNLPPGEDDGHTHVFHFDRFKGTRRRRVIYLLARSIVIITHLCWMLKEILHTCHY